MSFAREIGLSRLASTARRGDWSGYFVVFKMGPKRCRIRLPWSRMPAFQTSTLSLTTFPRIFGPISFGR